MESRLIQFATRSAWNHCGLITSAAGDTLEALNTGVTAGSLARFGAKEYVVVDTGLSDAQRAAAVRFGTLCAGEPYDWLDLLGIGFDALTHANVVVGTDKHVICSAFVANCLVAAGLTPPDDARMESPGALAAWWKVKPK
jgi:uncharacterized protein YycO